MRLLRKKHSAVPATMILPARSHWTVRLSSCAEAVAQRAAVVARRTKDLEEDFESGTLNDEWTTFSSDSAGQIRVGDDIVAAAGSYSLIMDRGTTGAFTLNEAIWTVDLSGITAATLEFSHADSNDEEHPLPASFTGSANGDGVSISQDGVTWYRVLDATNVESDQWARVSVDLMAAASSAGIALDSDFHIKFQQYDDFPLVVDGRAYDEIRIVTTPAVVSEDWYRFTLDDGQTATLAYRELKGDDPTSLELYDATGKLLATGIAALNAEQIIHRYRNATGNRLPGTYYARVVKPAEEYSLLIVRGADFDRELNGALHLPQDLGNDHRAIGFVDAGSSTGLVLQRSFPGPSFNGFIPPDPTLAVGPEQIVVLVNTELAVYDKATSAELFRQSISSSDGFFGTVGASTTVFDPWVVFDDQSQRFFIVGIDVASPDSVESVSGRFRGCDTDTRQRLAQVSTGLYAPPRVSGAWHAAALSRLREAGHQRRRRVHFGELLSDCRRLGRLRRHHGSRQIIAAQRRPGSRAVSGAFCRIQCVSVEPVRRRQHPVPGRRPGRVGRAAARRHRCPDQSSTAHDRPAGARIRTAGRRTAVGGRRTG